MKPKEENYTTETLKQLSNRSIKPLDVFADCWVRGRKEPMKYREAPEIDIQVMTSEELFGRKKKNNNNTAVPKLDTGVLSRHSITAVQNERFPRRNLTNEDISPDPLQHQTCFRQLVSVSSLK